MLSRLQIQNLAIIENVDVSFRDGFTVLTGESGAGKSLIIDSLSLLLGARASSELIRQGEEKASIKGTFRVSSKRLSALLSTLEIPFIDDELVIERTISKTKSTIKANGVAIPLATLSRIAGYLADIHSQFDVVKILSPENYLSIIDGYSYGETSQMKEAYLASRANYLSLKEEYEGLIKAKIKLEENRDFLEYQYKELKEANLSLGEEEEVEAELGMLKNYDKVYSLAQEAKAIIDEGFLDRLYELRKTLNKLLPFQPQLKESADLVEDRYFELNDLLANIRKSFSRIDYDPERLNELEQRSLDLKALKRKYRRDVPQLLAYYEELKGMLDEDNSIDDRIQAKKKEMDEAYADAKQKGKDLSSIRRGLAKSIEKEIEGNLKDLLLESRFSVSFLEESEPTLREDGIDLVDFLIETNVGEGMKSLSKIVSGGEASRIMLAFKVIFIKANRIETIIFDEIDVGISGVAAMAVAKKIKEISYSTQVISITHLPQVASYSDQSVLIAKKVKGGRTFVEIKELSLDEKIEEVAHLISGGHISPSQREYAKEMVYSAKSAK